MSFAAARSIFPSTTIMERLNMANQLIGQSFLVQFSDSDSDSKYAIYTRFYPVFSFGSNSNLGARIYHSCATDRAGRRHLCHLYLCLSTFCSAFKILEVVPRWKRLPSFQWMYRNSLTCILQDLLSFLITIAKMKPASIWNHLLSFSLIVISFPILRCRVREGTLQGNAN